MITMWHHSPLHQLGKTGAYMVTAGTYQKKRLFSSDELLTMVQDSLFRIAADYRWQLQAWAIMANHYHFIAIPDDASASLPNMVRKLHSQTTADANRRLARPDRKVWFQYWDTHLTFEKSYLARLNYVHNNPVHHGLVVTASAYPWCSAAWFEHNAKPSFFRTVSGFKYDRLSVPDDF
jgi:putative transposase